MKKSLVALACAFALSAAYATPPGNNGGGHGGCGVGQQTNGCGGGTPGPAGPAGPQGPQGPQGPAGKDGKDGAQGPQGVAGRDGKDGKDGSNGERGATGQTGKEGAIGATGAAGADGKEGARGEKGESANEFATVVQMNGLRDEVRAIGRNAYAGSAGAIAIGSIPQAPDPGTKIIGVGAGYYRGEAALAAGMSWRSDSGKWITKASASVDTRGGVGLGVGAAYVWK